MPDNETFGERLRRLRKKQGLTQEKLAELTESHTITVSKWETDKQAPKMLTIKRLAAALNVKEDELLNGVPEQGGWVLHVEIGNTREDILDMKNIKQKPISVIITDAEAGAIKIGGSYELWTDDKLFSQMIKDLKKLRSAVIANGRTFGSIK